MRTLQVPIVSLCALGGLVDAQLRSISDRVAVEECVEAGRDDLFPVERRAATITGLESLNTQTEKDVFGTDIKYGANFKVITDAMSKEQYVLTQCGTEKPTDAIVAELAAKPSADYKRKDFTIPVQRATATSTVQLGFLEALGVADRIEGISDSAVGACWQKAKGCGSTLETSWGNATLRASQLDNAEVAFMDCSATSPVDCSNVNSRSNGVHFAATQADSALATAAYVSMMAAFFNKEDVANAFFEDVKSGYGALSSTASSGTKPVVAWISYDSWGNNFVLSQATYKMDLVTAAGGSNIDGAAMRASVGTDLMSESLAVPSNAAAGKTFKISPDSFNGSMADASTAFFDALKDVDVVIDETSIWPENPKNYNMTHFYSKFALASDSTLPFLNKVFRVDGTLNEKGDYDWFESRVARPDLAVQGLKRILKPDANMPFKYFRNIAAGEQSKLVSSSSCEVALPVCDSDVLATPIKAVSPVISGSVCLMPTAFLLYCLAVLRLF